MQESTNKPRVFVSSTICDFRDLRSALKFWLEAQGFEVRMSEFNDFPRRPDQGTFDSCFRAIEDCHYYVLLVGGRKGSEYQDGVSVTQQEFRTAAGLAKQGRIKPVLFVRSEVDTALSERKSLRTRKTSTSGHARQRKSETLQDPPFIESFLSEIKTTEALQLGSEGPAGTMWYYRFNSFAEVVDALRINLRLQRTVGRQAFLANLNWEIDENIARLTQNDRGKPFPSHWWMSKCRTEVKILTGDLASQVQLGYEFTRGVAVFWMALPGTEALKTIALQEAILSGEFLVYHQDTGRLMGGNVYQGMQALYAAIESYRSLRGLLQQPDYLKTFEAIFQAVRHKQRETSIPGYQLLYLFRIHDISVDILRLSTALLRYILEPEAELRMPDLSPVTPLETRPESLEWSSDVI